MLCVDEEGTCLDCGHSVYENDGSEETHDCDRARLADTYHAFEARKTVGGTFICGICFEVERWDSHHPEVAA